MDAFRARMRRPDPVLLAATSLMLTGLIAAIVLGNVLVAEGSPTSFARASSPPLALPSRPIASAPPSPAPTPTVAELPQSAGWTPLSWSPDGSALLLRRNTEFAISIDSGPPTPIEARQAGWWPRFGRALWFVVPRDGRMHLLLRDLNGAPLAVLARARDIDAVAWTPDGQTVAVGGPDGVLVGSPGGRLDRVTATRPASLALSPDARWLAVIPRFADGVLRPRRPGK